MAKSVDQGKTWTPIATVDMHTYQQVGMVGEVRGEAQEGMMIKFQPLHRLLALELGYQCPKMHEKCDGTCTFDASRNSACFDWDFARIFLHEMVIDGQKQDFSSLNTMQSNGWNFQCRSKDSTCQPPMTVIDFGNGYNMVRQDGANFYYTYTFTGINTVVVRTYRLSNNGYTGWRPAVSQVTAYSDEACTAEIDTFYVSESGYHSGKDGRLALDGASSTAWRPQCHPCTANAAWLQFTTIVEARCIQALNLGQGSGGGKSWNVGIEVELQHASGSWGTVMQSFSGNTAIISAKSWSCAISGRSPGTSFGQVFVSSIDDCKASCESVEGCKAIIWRKSTGGCYRLDRFYESNYEKVSDDAQVANYGNNQACSDVCVNWFGNNLDWSSIPFEQIGNTPWGYTPNGCTSDAVSSHGAYSCAVQVGATGAFINCNGDCRDGVCESLPSTTDSITAVELSADALLVVTDIGELAFNEIFRSCPVVQYERNGEVHSIYKRTSPIPDEFNAYQIFTDTWRDTPSNELNVDFEIFSTLGDLINNENQWSFCNYNDPDVAYPRDCGPQGAVGHQWFTMPGGIFNAPGIKNGLAFTLFKECPIDIGTPEPTPLPTINPTVSPTLNPTLTPSLSPSPSPTNEPTMSPTVNPTANPSSYPTAGDFIIKVKGFHGQPKNVLDANKLQGEGQDDIDIEMFRFKRKVVPVSRRLLKQNKD